MTAGRRSRRRSTKVRGWERDAKRAYRELTKIRRTLRAAKTSAREEGLAGSVDALDNAIDLIARAQGYVKYATD